MDKDNTGHTLRGVTATRLIDLLQEHVDTHGNTEVLVDTEDGFGTTVREARSRESYQSNPLVFVLQADTTDEPQQLGDWAESAAEQGKPQKLSSRDRLVELARAAVGQLDADDTGVTLETVEAMEALAQAVGLQLQEGGLLDQIRADYTM